jgi:hypothetical protein
MNGYPVYTTPTPDAPIQLATGRFRIEQGSYVGEGDGNLAVVWASRPRLCFDRPSLDPPGPLQTADCTLTHVNTTAQAAASITDAHHSHGLSGQGLGARGHLRGAMVVGADAGADHVLFHLVNFWSYLAPHTPEAGYHPRRVVFEGGGWRVTLQEVPAAEGLFRALRDESGCGITHAGRAQKVDGSPITRSDAQNLFSALAYFFSFSRGLWSPAVLHIARDAADAVLWQEWLVQPATPWRMVLSWFPLHEAACLAGVFPGFMRLWQHPDWQDILRVVIHWYLESNLQAGAIEGAVVLCQNALERLAYYFLVHDRGVLTEQAFGNGPGRQSAAQRIRRLLQELGVPAVIGANTVRINHLAAVATARGWMDIPDALTVLRNSIIHPDHHNTQRLQNYPIPARNEAWILGLWTLEVCLLKLFGHAGNYANRRTIRFEGEVELVP